MPPSLLKLDCMDFADESASGIFTPMRDHVPLDKTTEPSGQSTASYALAVSCEAHATTLIFPPNSFAISGLNSPTTVPGSDNFLNNFDGNPSFSISSGSNSRVLRLSSAPVDASVYSFTFTPVSKYSRYSGIIRKSVAFSSLPFILSSYS